LFCWFRYTIRLHAVLLKKHKVAFDGSTATEGRNQPEMENPFPVTAGGIDHDPICT